MEIEWSWIGMKKISGWWVGWGPSKKTLWFFFFWFCSVSLDGTKLFDEIIRFPLRNIKDLEKKCLTLFGWCARAHVKGWTKNQKKWPWIVWISKNYDKKIDWKCSKMNFCNKNCWGSVRAGDHVNKLCQVWKCARGVDNAIQMIWNDI